MGFELGIWLDYFMVMIVVMVLARCCMHLRMEGEAVVIVSIVQSNKLEGRIE